MPRSMPITLCCCLALALAAGCSSDDGGGNDAGNTPQPDTGHTPQPEAGGLFITITSPAAGAQWKAGSEQKIEWQTSLEDVAISYSTDGGSTWKRISDSVDTSSPDWTSYPWAVPDAPTTAAVIEIKGYDGEIPTRSETFSIIQ